MGSRLDKNNCININFFSAKWMMVSHRWIINNKAMGCALVIFYFLGQNAWPNNLRKNGCFGSRLRDGLSGGGGEVWGSWSILGAGEGSWSHCSQEAGRDEHWLPASCSFLCILKPQRVEWGCTHWRWALLPKSSSLGKPSQALPEACPLGDF